MKEIKDDYCEDLEFCLKEKKKFYYEKKLFFQLQKDFESHLFISKICFCI
jgi:hypothetical protein